VFPGVSAEGAAFWIVRTAPIALRRFLWSKFWIGLLPVFLLTEGLTVAANHFLGIDPFLRVVAAVTVLLMSVAMVGLATGLGARYPRFNAENPSQIAGSYGGVAFMIAAVLYTIVVIVLVGWPSSTVLWYRFARVSMSATVRAQVVGGFAAAAALSLGLCAYGMRSGVAALDDMGK
jgi:ABC-2 type transport system permease protein